MRIIHSEVQKPKKLLVQQYGVHGEICFYAIGANNKDEFTIGIWNIKYKNNEN